MGSLREYLSEMNIKHGEEDKKATKIDINRKEDGFYYCPVCGKQIDEDVCDEINYCINCGQAINLI